MEYKHSQPKTDTMAAKIFAVALLCLGAALSANVQPCGKNPSVDCVAKFIAGNNAGRCRPGKDANLASYPAHQVFDAPFFHVSITRDMIISGIDKAVIEEFSVDEASGKAALKLQLNYHATGNAVISIHTTTPDTVVNTKLVEDIDALTITVELGNYKMLSKAVVTSSIAKGVLAVYSDVTYLTDGSTSNPVVAKFVDTLNDNREKMAEVTNAARAKSIGEAFVVNKICNVA